MIDSKVANNLTALLFHRVLFQYCILDVDECSSDDDVCPEFSACTNTIGSYFCTCNFGYYRINQVCTGIPWYILNPTS